MGDNNVNSVNNSNNVKWSKQLAKQLDAADGKEDGKISASVWNGYLNSIGSKGNKIKNFINLSNAEKSFDYYKTTKDKGKIDYNNWQTQLTSYKNSQTQSTEQTSDTSSAKTLQPAAEQPAAVEPEPIAASMQEVLSNESVQATNMTELQLDIYNKYSSNLSTEQTSDTSSAKTLQPAAEQLAAAEPGTIAEAIQADLLDCNRKPIKKG